VGQRGESEIKRKSLPKYCQGEGEKQETEEKGAYSSLEEGRGKGEKEAN